MKELFVQLAAYNLWANQLLLAVIENLTEEQQKAVAKSSFSSLHLTVLHIWNAESIWWQRMKLTEQITGPPERFNFNMKDVCDGLLEQDKQWQDWIRSVDEQTLQHQLVYYNSKSERFTQPVFQVLLHLFNHSTYHRGQLVNILHQIDIHKIPSTDFIGWSRTKI